MKNKWKSLYVILPIVAVAGLGTLFVNLGIDWFNALVKPSQWIPNWVIPVVWTIIYLAFLVILFVTFRFLILVISSITLSRSFSSFLYTSFSLYFG